MAFRRGPRTQVAPTDLHSEYGSDIDPELLTANTSAPLDKYSDYGSELDTEGEQILSQKLSGLEGTSIKRLVLEGLEEDDNTRCVVHLPKYSSQDSEQLLATSIREKHAEVEGKVDGDRQTSYSALANRPQVERNVSVGKEQYEEPDTLSPIQRFRTAPKKALSVTDLVSPAWCEIQYLYTLTKYGRKKSTPAMKQGSRVHKELESQVHEVVPVDIQTKEDGWALRIWNVVQGLRTLRATGLTRELEVWGIIHGEVVNGIIDEVSYACPDPELESTLAQSKGTSIPSNQTKITDLFQPQPPEVSPWLTAPHPSRKIYLTDVKTRSGKYIPKGASLRPMQMQLMLYHRLLSELATNTVPADTLFARYSLDPKAPFSSAFIHEISALDGHVVPETSGDIEYAAFYTNQPDSINELAQYNSLTQLWSLMISEFQLTIPTADAIGLVLQGEFRSQGTGTILGHHTFAYNDAKHQAYVDDEMKWWKGEREAKGVEMEEAFKCGICEFAEGCEWRSKKTEESIAVHRARRKQSDGK